MTVPHNNTATRPSTNAGSRRHVKANNIGGSFPKSTKKSGCGCSH